MKKITLLAVAALAISFASCKKDYKCVCTSTSGSVTVENTITAKTSKKSATAWCEAAPKNITTVNGTVVTSTGTAPTCVIK